MIRGALFVIAVAAGGVAAFISQASSPDYVHLFWTFLPVVVAHVGAVAVYCFRVRHWTRWILVCIALFTLFCWVEFAYRVFPVHPNRSLRAAAGRSDASINIMKVHPLQSTLAPASGA
ncbi:MAG: hypothetical protein DMF06_03105 [Verrucomicrobia bacterium]|nr:MAG: hypothetical protein DMF06_03105 [Verrucomicrobiota bacterium]